MVVGGVENGGWIGKGGDRVEDRMAVSKQAPTPPPTLSTVALGAYTMSGKEKRCTELRCTDRRTESPHSPKSPAPNLPS